ncbi:MAG: efflux RND transporter periplasmic adaptor subunit [Devosia sp.]|nr:efflux RND transporter periplasmic adaptor subunit [Devosia sp.]
MPDTKTPTRVHRSRRGRVWLIIVLLVLAAGGGWYLWQRYQGSSTAAAPQTAQVTRADVQETVLANGILQANTLVSVGAQVSGRIEKLDVKVGDVVKKGALIAEIDPSDQQNTLKTATASLASAKAQLHSAQASVEAAQAALDRSDQLAAKGVVSTSDHETAQATLRTDQAQVEVEQAAVQQAEISVDSANNNLNRTNITAPSDGTIVSVLVDAGQTVNAAQSSPTIVKLADLNTMVIKAQISEADVPRVKPGQAVYFTILGEPDNKINATLLSINPAPDSVANESNTTVSTSTSAIYYNGQFQVPNPDGKLRIDMTAEVTIILAEAKNALTVPFTALTKTPDGYVVAVYDPATKTNLLTKVTVGITNNVTAEITSGLKEGQLVVTTGASRSGAAASGDMPGGAQAGSRFRSPMGF